MDRHFYDPRQTHFTRLLALCSRNLDKLDEFDKQIFYETHDWFYREYSTKGSTNVYTH